jgi:uncharacterized membrane protein YsdA (DUF1294 family)
VITPTEAEYIFQNYISFTFFSLTKKSNKKSQAKTPNPFLLTFLLFFYLAQMSASQFFTHSSLQLRQKN